jgi:hypothetical protein
MSCGLGAVILIFLILKHGESISPDQAQMLEQDIESAKKDLITLTDSLQKKKNEITDLNSLIVNKEELIKKVSNDLTIEKKSRDKLLESNKQAQKEIKEIEDSIPDLISRSDDGERQYLTGLIIEGSHIVYLLDTSASMMDENIQNIFRLSLLDEKSKNTKKWKRAKDSLTWLTARLPKNSKFTILTFDQDVKSHTNNKWLSSGNSFEVNGALSSALKEIPENGTNLEKALERTKQMFPLPDAVYIITDGLPTLGEPMSQFYQKVISGEQRKCLKPSSSITSECRHVLFQKAKENYLSGKKIKTSTILLPLQGDPRAGSDYWNLGLQSGGTLISPSRDWP